MQSIGQARGDGRMIREAGAGFLQKQNGLGDLAVGQHGIGSG
jgi:hypothetical protein